MQLHLKQCNTAAQWIHPNNQSSANDCFFGKTTNNNNNNNNGMESRNVHKQLSVSGSLPPPVGCTALRPSLRLHWENSSGWIKPQADGCSVWGLFGFCLGEGDGTHSCLWVLSPPWTPVFHLSLSLWPKNSSNLGAASFFFSVRRTRDYCCNLNTRRPTCTPTATVNWCSALF